MIITLCSSARFYNMIPGIKQELEKQGNTIFTPSLEFSGQDAKLKIENDLIMKHFRKIEQADAILVINHEKNGIKGYIGGNTLMEMGLAYYLGKKIYMINPVPEINYKDEIIALNPVIIGNDWSKIIQ